jgi:hypothetical protein
MAMHDVIELVHTGAVHAVVGSTPDFVDLPAAMTAMADRRTVGRVIVMV